MYFTQLTILRIITNTDTGDQFKKKSKSMSVDFVFLTDITRVKDGFLMSL